jgi:hypothetical protein
MRRDWLSTAVSGGTVQAYRSEANARLITCLQHYQCYSHQVRLLLGPLGPLRQIKSESLNWQLTTAIENHPSPKPRLHHAVYAPT